MASPIRVHLRRVSTVEALASALRERILDGSLAAGTALREAEITETFGVSRHSVRTALQALAHEGVLRHAPHRGAYVPDMTADDVADVFRLRAVLETSAVRELAAGGGQLQDVRRAVQELKAVGPDAPWSAVRDSDLAFHRALVDAIGSPRTSRSYASLVTELRLCFLQLRPELEDQAGIARQHEEIFRAIEAGDAGVAAALVERHLRQSLADIVGAIAEP
jgi:DNA-binding GntR family transcriptional regulator